MAEMYRKILLNLKSGGHFVGVTPPPTNDPAGHVERESTVRHYRRLQEVWFVTINEVVEDGVYFHLHANTRGWGSRLR